MPRRGLRESLRQDVWGASIQKSSFILDAYNSDVGKKLNPPQETKDPELDPKAREILLMYDETFTGFTGSGVMQFDSED